MSENIIIHPSAEWLVAVWFGLVGVLGAVITALAIRYRKFGMKCAIKKAAIEFPGETIVERKWLSKKPRKIVQLRFMSGKEVRYEISKGTEDAFQCKEWV